MKERQMEAYEEQAKEKWGNTEEYQEYKKKTAGRPAEIQSQLKCEMSDIFKQFGLIKAQSPNSSMAQLLVGKLQNHITDNYYQCTKQILSSLGTMYVSDGDFRLSIDGEGGTGTAEFVNQAIKAYIRKNSYFE